MFQKSDRASEKRGSAARQIRRLTLTAVFVALGVAVKSITKIPLSAFGGGMQISFGGIFTFFPAALFGPVWGGVASALSDLIGCIIAPTGAYIPWLTVTAFLGGFIKGLLWKLLTSERGVHAMRRARLPVTVVLICLGLLGGAFGISLMRDGVLPEGTLISAKEELPQRYEIDAMTRDGELSPLSRLAVSLAQYNKDTYTLTGFPATALDEDGTLTLPTKVFDGESGQEITPTKLSAGALKEQDVTTVRHGGGYKTIGDSTTENIEIVKDETLNGQSAATVAEGYTYSSSDTYRKYLSGYINFAFAGLLIVSLMGLGFIGVLCLVERIRHKRETENAGLYGKIALSILLSGTIVTTINTWILRAYTPAWTGREILILLIPRVVEEWLVCLIQAYAISLLFAMLTKGRLRSLMEDLKK